MADFSITGSCHKDISTQPPSGPDCPPPGTYPERYECAADLGTETTSVVAVDGDTCEVLPIMTMRDGTQVTSLNCGKIWDAALKVDLPKESYRITYDPKSGKYKFEWVVYSKSPVTSRTVTVTK